MLVISKIMMNERKQKTKDKYAGNISGCDATSRMDLTTVQ